MPSAQIAVGPAGTGGSGLDDGPGMQFPYTLRYQSEGQLPALPDGRCPRLPDSVFPMEVRTTAGDEAYLSSNQGGASAVISVSGVPGTDYWPYLREVDALLGDFGARVHWGKLHFLTRTQLADRYPESERFIAIRRELDPQGLSSSTTTCASCSPDPRGPLSLEQGSVRPRCGARSRRASTAGSCRRC